MDDPDEIELGSPVAETGDPQIVGEECGMPDVIQTDLTGGQLVTVYDLNLQTPADLSLDAVGALPYDAITTTELPVEPEKDSEGPEVVAVETVVTTTVPGAKLQMKNVKTSNIGSGDVERVDLTDDTLPTITVRDVDSFSFPSGEINWSDPQIMDKVLVTSNSGVAENGEQLDLAVSPCDIANVASQPQWFIALVPDTNGEVVTIPQQVLPQPVIDHDQKQISTLSEIRKREKDREKKRELRQDPQFRCKEKEQAKIRMRLKRTDPDYRKQEREKDRVRRREARQKNNISREKERDRDRVYKRLQRTIFPSLNTVYTKVDIEELPYAEVDLGEESEDTGLDVTDDQKLDVC